MTSAQPAPLGLVNIGTLVTGLLDDPRRDAESILAADGRISAIGPAIETDAADADVVVDCRGTTVLPGLIDSIAT